VYGTPTERRLVQAYLAIFLVAAGEDGARTVTLARFGTYEVRLIEFGQAMAAEVSPLWLELYDHAAAATLDSCGRSDFEEAVTAAGELIARAKALSLHSAPLATCGEGACPRV
jgi:hypothetical protein